MGSSKSKLQIITYEEAEQRVKPKELNRLKIAFNQHAKNGYINWETFHTELFGSFLPNSISEILFKSLKASSNANGITFKEFMIFIVLLTKGSDEEIGKLLYNIYCNESGSGVEYSDLLFSADTFFYKEEIKTARQFVNENQIMSQDNFIQWVLKHPRFNQLSEWLFETIPNTDALNNGSGRQNRRALQLTDDSGPPDLYQAVAGITHLSEKEVIDLEKQYRRLLSSFPNKLDLMLFKQLTCPPIPDKIIKSVFKIFDENGDGNVDIKELACAISACTRGPVTERKKFCCKVFDRNGDGFLDLDDISLLHEMCLLAKINPEKDDGWFKRCSLKFRSLVSLAKLEENNLLSIEDLLVWLNETDFIEPFMSLLNEICVLIFGMRPDNRIEEIQVISNWLSRAESSDFSSLKSVSIINKDWWDYWLMYIQRPFDLLSNPNNNITTKSPRILRKSESSRSMSMLMLSSSGKRHQYDFTQNGSSKDRINDEDQHHITGRYRQLKFCNYELSERIFPVIPTFATNLMPLSPTPDPECISQNQNQNRFSFSINNRCLLVNNNFKAYPNINSLSDSDDETPLWVIDPCVILNRDFVLIPDNVWFCLVSWYGGGPWIRRPLWTNSTNHTSTQSLHADNEKEEKRFGSLVFRRMKSVTLVVELYLLNLLIAVHNLTSSTAPQSMLSSEMSNGPRLEIPSVALTSGTLNFSGSTLNTSAIPFSSNTNQLRHHIKYHVSVSRRISLADLLNFVARKLNLNIEEIRLWRMNADNNMVLLEDEEKLLSELSFKNFDKILLEHRNSDLTWPEELSQLAKNKLLQNRKASVNKGVTGLSNVGNTCFFNSALQCISNTMPLTEYFLRNFHLSEINKENIFGCKGFLALRYGELIRDLWSGSSSLIVPIKLKMTLAKYVKQFADHQQHDAQELLSALLDALHEDLNRIREKPKYSELKDSDGRKDEEVANEAWKAHIMSNQSIIVDLFHGLLKSDVTCDVCNNSSVRFDAFSILSLPIPMEIKEELEISVFSPYQNENSITNTLSSVYTVSLLSSELIVSNVIKQLSIQTEVAENRLCLTLVENRKISMILDGSSPIQKSWKLHAYVVDIVGEELEDTSFVYFVFYHRKLIIKTNYILAQTRLVPELFDNPIVKKVSKLKLTKFTNEDIYALVASLSLVDKIQKSNNSPDDDHKGNNQGQMSYSSDHLSVNSSFDSSLTSNHAIDCDQQYRLQPFVLTAVESSGQKCRKCHWSKFCFGCQLPENKLIYEDANSCNEIHYFCVDWALATLHLRFHSNHQIIPKDSQRNSCILKSPLPKSPLTLFDCIEHFLSKEALDKDTLYQCSKCKKPQPVHKKLDLWNLPPILIIHLKRFQFLMNKWQKSNRFVQFPVRDLNFQKFLQYRFQKEDANNVVVPQNQNKQENSISNPNDQNNNNDVSFNPLPETLTEPITKSIGSPMYELFAVSCHLGSLQMGHYITYARNKDNNKWYLFNDSICREVSEKEVQNSSAYLLFYQRIGFRWDDLLSSISQRYSSNSGDDCSGDANGDYNVMTATELAASTSDDGMDTEIKKSCTIQ